MKFYANLKTFESQVSFKAEPPLPRDSLFFVQEKKNVNNNSNKKANYKLTMLLSSIEMDIIKSALEKNACWLHV